MNRRQKKKAYKKQYGHNPPVKSYFYQAYGVDMQNVADALEKGVKLACEAITEAIAAVTKNITAAWEYTKERIQTMTEEEYAEYLEALTPEQRGWAAVIRMGREKQQNTDGVNMIVLPRKDHEELHRLNWAAVAGQESGKEI